MPCQCGYPDGMSPLERMVLPEAPPSGKPSSLWETFHQDTHTGMAYLYNVTDAMILNIVNNTVVFIHSMFTFVVLLLFSVDYDLPLQWGSGQTGSGRHRPDRGK